MRPAPRTAAWLALFALGCAASRAGAGDAGLDAPDTEDAAPPAPDAWERWVDEYTSARCATQVRCASASAYPRAVGECRHAADAIRDTLAPSLRDGRLRFDAEAAAACLDALAELPCAVWSSWAVSWEPALASCARALAPQVGLGEACRPSRLLFEPWQECAGDAYCDERADCRATCRARPGPGEPCANEHPSRACAAGWHCEGSRCGVACAEDMDCRSDADPFAICEDGGCVRVAPGGLGGPCGRVPCDLGLECADEVCAPSGVAEGEDCSTTPCAHPLRCSAGRCALPRALGEPCATADCEPGLHCVDPDGVEPGGTGPRCAVSREGAPCSFWPIHGADPCGPDALRCVGDPQRCRAPLARGAPCGDDRECDEGLLCEAGRCARTALEGEACGAEIACHSSSDCVEGRCERRPGVGAPCDALRRCLEGRCENGRCRLLGAGEVCAGDGLRECQTICSGTCAAGADEGAPCLDPSECAAGLDCRIARDGERSCAPVCGAW